ncbi:MAG: hypothetical protein E6R08_00545 [Nevskiaceae bacterium]|nr:MAG: hypothetical protein E6R08_00545 [Nevskiaceae bacterium]
MHYGEHALEVPVARGVGLASAGQPLSENTAALHLDEAMRGMIDRVGELARSRGRVTWKYINEAVGPDKRLWRRLMRSTASNADDQAVAYCRETWPEIMDAVELELKASKGKGSGDEDDSVLLHGTMTYTQKLLACLRRLASAEDFDQEDSFGNDVKCLRFLRKVSSGQGRSLWSDGDKRHLHLEVVRLMHIRLADGSELRNSAMADAKAMMAWVSAQKEVEAKMQLPVTFGDGLHLKQKRVAVATELLKRKVDEKTMQDALGSSIKSAKQLVRDGARRERSPSLHARSTVNVLDRKQLIADAEQRGRRELVLAMLEGKEQPGGWIGSAGKFHILTNAGQLRFVTTDVELAAEFVRWLSSPGGTGSGAIRVKVTRKDGQELTHGFVVGIRKSLNLPEDQVGAAPFNWKPVNEQITKARSQIVMSVEVDAAEELGRARGILATAQAAWKGRGQVPMNLTTVEQATWKRLLEGLAPSASQQDH